MSSYCSASWFPGGAMPMGSPMPASFPRWFPPSHLQSPRLLVTVWLLMLSPVHITGNSHHPQFTLSPIQNIPNSHHPQSRTCSIHIIPNSYCPQFTSSPNCKIPVHFPSSPIHIIPNSCCPQFLSSSFTPLSIDSIPNLHHPMFSSSPVHVVR